MTFGYTNNQQQSSLQDDNLQSQNFRVESLVEEALKCKTTESMKSFIVRMLESSQTNALNYNTQQHRLNDLSNLHQLQQKLEGTSSGRQQKALGFHIVQTEITTDSLAGFVFTRGQIIRQRIIRRKDGMNLVKSETRQLTDQKMLHIPQEIEEGARENAIDPEKAIQSHLLKLTQVNQFRDYVNLTGHRDDIRESLKLPKHGLHAGPQLMRWKKHLGGIHSEYLYCSSSRDGGTVAEMHREDGDLHSANILYAGKPKLWIFISPCSRNALEYNLQKHFGIAADCSCSQFVRHLHCLPSPSQLRQWGILYSIRRQYPGDLVLILPDVYHYVINEGINLAGAINYTEPDWQLNNLYTDCTDRCSGNSIPMKRLASSLASEPRPLDVEEDFGFPQSKRSNPNTLHRNPRQKRRHQTNQSFRREANRDNGSNRYRINHSEVESEAQGDMDSCSILTSDDTASVSLSSTSLSSLETTPETPSETEQEASRTTLNKRNMSTSYLQLAEDSQMNDQSQQSLREMTMSDPRHYPSNGSCEESSSVFSNEEARLDSAEPVPCSELVAGASGNVAEISLKQLQNLELLQWNPMFQAFRQESDLSAGMIYRLMAYASVPGNVNVLERLQSVLSEARRHISLYTEPISTFPTLWNRYTLALGKSAFWKLQQIMSEIQIVRDYRQREVRLRLEKEAQNEGKSHQVQEIDRTNKRVATLVLDEIQEENGSKGDDGFRKKYNQAKKNGLAILSLKGLFGISEDNIIGLLLLLPTEPTPSSLDDGIEADVNTFSKILRPLEKAFFRNIFLRLRPNFPMLCSGAAKHLDPFLCKEFYELELQFKTFENRKALDTNHIFHCFEPIVRSEVVINGD